MNKTLVLTAVCILFLMPDIQAQEKFKGASVYSYLGLGLPNDFRSPDGTSMGVTGVALVNQFSTNNANPAAWGNLFYTSASGGLGLRNFNAQDGSGRLKSTLIDIGQFQLNFPVLREKLGISMSLAPLTESVYSITEMITLAPGTVVADTLTYQLDSRGRGGINRFEVGAGYKINENLSIGYAPSLIFGVIRHRLDVSFSEQGFVGQNYTNKSSYVGMGNRFGILYKQSSFLKKDDFASFGLTASLPVDLNSRREIIFENEENRSFLRDRTDFVGSGNDTYPMEIVAGAGYFTNDYLFLTSEVLYQQWGTVKNFSGQNEEFLKDRVKFSLGTQYSAYARPERSILTRFIYRAGVSYDTGHLSLNGVAVNTVMFSAGLGIPSQRTTSTVDVNFDFGIRGTTSHELVREKIFAVRLSLNLSEMMFLQRKLQ